MRPLQNLKVRVSSKRKLTAPHTWHAAEVLLYFLAATRQGQTP